MALRRAYLVARVVSLLSPPLAAILLLAPPFAHRHAFAAAGVVALIAMALSQIVLEGLRAYVLYNTGRWTDLFGKLRTRAEQPGRFKTWLILHLIFAIIWIALAGFFLTLTTSMR